MGVSIGVAQSTEEVQPQDCSLKGPWGSLCPCPPPSNAGILLHSLYSNAPSHGELRMLSVSLRQASALPPPLTQFSGTIHPR